MADAEFVEADTHAQVPIAPSGDRCASQPGPRPHLRFGRVRHGPVLPDHVRRDGHLNEVVAGARGIRLQIGRAFILIYDQPPKAPRGGAFHHLGIETDDLAALVGRMKSHGFVFRKPIHEDKAFKYVMIAGPDDLLIELFECKEPARWRIRSDDEDR